MQAHLGFKAMGVGTAIGLLDVQNASMNNEKFGATSSVSVTVSAVEIGNKRGALYTII